MELRRFIDPYRQRQFAERFYIHKLDGAYDEDLCAFTKPTRWTEQQFIKELSKEFVMFKNMDTPLNPEVKLYTAVSTIRKAYQLVQARFAANSEHPHELEVEVFADRLDRLGVPPINGIRLGQITKIIMDKLTKQIKNGKARDRALEELIGTCRDVRQGSELLPLTFTEVKEALRENISDCIPEINVNKVVNQTLQRLGWSAVRPDDIKTMTVLQITQAVAQNPDLHKKLYAYYIGTHHINFSQ